MTSRVSLQAGDYRAELLPEAGGSIASLAWRHPDRGWLDLLRPTPPNADKAQETACFPMLPYANRIRDGRFTFRGRTVQMPEGVLSRHNLHGTGWLQAWQVAEQAPGRVLLRQRHEPDAWPYAFEASQEFVLSRDGLAVRLSAVNRANEPMPFGFGLHPYFPRTPKTRLTAAVSGWWEVDAEVLPTRLVDLPPVADPREGLTVSALTCDNTYSGWTGTARIDWPERGTRLALIASEPLRALYLYVPAGEDFFCLEPASNFTDAFNRAAAGRTDTGMMVLASGAKAHAEVLFSASALPA